MAPVRTLYATLPITRRTVVIGRYLALVVLYLAVALIATIAAAIIAAAKGRAVELGVLASVNLIACVILGVGLAVELPFFFSVGFTRARQMMHIPMIVLAGVTWLVSRTSLLDTDAFASATVSPPSPVILGTMVVIVVGALEVSAGISTARYGRRDL